jgi:hypothetical protein
MNPGASIHTTGDFFNCIQKSVSWAITSAVVFSAFTTSTHFIICAGLKKCNPATLSGLEIFCCNKLIDKEEVLLAKMSQFQTLLRLPTFVLQY